MEKIRIKNLEEDVYYEKLDNGLEVYLYTKDDIYTNYVTFTTNGYGHGVGMSQYGARAMALEGAGYEEILKHYYTGVEIEKVTP